MTEGNHLWQELCCAEERWLEMDDGTMKRVDALTAEQVALRPTVEPEGLQVLRNAREWAVRRYALSDAGKARTMGMTTKQYRAWRMRQRGKSVGSARAGRMTGVGKPVRGEVATASECAPLCSANITS